MAAFDSIPDLYVLLSAIAKEDVVIRKRLQTGGFSDSQAATLDRIGVDEVVAVLGNVAGHGARRLLGHLDAEPVIENAGVPVAVIRAHGRGKVCGFGAVTVH